MQVFLLLEPFQQQFVQTGIDVPVEISEIVARSVVPMIGELDPAAQLHRPALSHQLAAEDPPRDKRQVLKFLQKIGIE